MYLTLPVDILNQPILWKEVFTGKEQTFLDWFFNNYHTYFTDEELETSFDDMLPTHTQLEIWFDQWASFKPAYLDTTNMIDKKMLIALSLIKNKMFLEDITL